jgi:hypothetical protein
MARAKVYAIARELGEVLARARTTPMVLVREAVKAAMRGEIDEDDALSLYETYIKKSQVTDTVDAASNTMRANASKLRQIIRCASARKDALDLLNRVIDMHGKVSRHLPTKSPYWAMVLACRQQLQQDRPLSSSQIEKLLRK